MADYTTDEALLAGLLNDHRLVVLRLPLRTERNYVLPPNSAASSHHQ